MKWNFGWNEISQEGAFLWAFLAHLAASLVQPVISSLVKGIRGKEVRRAGREYIDKIWIKHG